MELENWEDIELREPVKPPVQYDNELQIEIPLSASLPADWTTLFRNQPFDGPCAGRPTLDPPNMTVTVRGAIEDDGILSCIDALRSHITEINAEFRNDVLPRLIAARDSAQGRQEAADALFERIKNHIKADD